jgi:hypothetical protein
VKIRITAHNPQHSGKIRYTEPQLFAFYFDKPALRLNCEQTVFSRGLERQNMSDPAYPSLQGVDAVSNAAISLKATNLGANSASIIVAGAGHVELSGPTIQWATLDGKSLQLKDGKVSFEAAGAGELVLGIQSTQ